MIRLAVSRVTIDYIENMNSVCQYVFNVWHNMSQEKLDHLVEEFMDAQPPTVSDKLFCVYVQIYADIHKENLLALTEKQYELFQDL
jgi:hypothetical protein